MCYFISLACPRNCIQTRTCSSCLAFSDVCMSDLDISEVFWSRSREERLQKGRRRLARTRVNMLCFLDSHDIKESKACRKTTN